MGEKLNKIVHYVLVYIALLLAWTPIMNYWQGDVARTAATAFVVFVVADQIAEKYLLGEKTLLEED